MAREKVGRWRERSREEAFCCSVYRVSKRQVVEPVKGTPFEAFVLEMPDWVTVVPRDPEGRYVMVRQYRHGAARVTLEFPAGVVDPEDRDPAGAARRELAEETGYRAGSLDRLALVEPNPALQDNRCHIYRATGLELLESGAAALDSEPIEVVKLTPAELERRMGAGEISHALMQLAYFHERKR